MTRGKLLIHHYHKNSLKLLKYSNPSIEKKFLLSHYYFSDNRNLVIWALFCDPPVGKGDFTLNLESLLSISCAFRVLHIMIYCQLLFTLFDASISENLSCYKKFKDMPERERNEEVENDVKWDK